MLRIEETDQPIHPALPARNGELVCSVRSVELIIGIATRPDPPREAPREGWRQRPGAQRPYGSYEPPGTEQRDTRADEEHRQPTTRQLVDDHDRSPLSHMPSTRES